MIANLNFQIKDLSGNEFIGDNSNAGKIIAQSLMLSNKGNSVKMYDWALKLYNGQDLHIDETDKKTLIDFIESSEQITVIVKAQVLNALNN